MRLQASPKVIKSSEWVFAQTADDVGESVSGVTVNLLMCEAGTPQLRWVWYKCTCMEEYMDEE